MPLQTSEKKLLAILLKPHGNEAREIALFRRRIFSVSGDTSALAFPEAVPLVFSPHTALSRADLRGSRDGLREAWKVFPGCFHSTGIIEMGGSLFLNMGEPVDSFIEALRRVLPNAGFRSLGGAQDQTANFISDFGFETACFGFFLCKSGRVSIESAKALEPPPISFFDAELVLCRLEAGDNPLMAMSWIELCGVKRPGLRPARSFGLSPLPDKARDLKLR